MNPDELSPDDFKLLLKVPTTQRTFQCLCGCIINASKNKLSTKCACGKVWKLKNSFAAGTKDDKGWQLPYTR